jgi:hypothetical protein
MHGVGTRTALPVPFHYALTGAAVALLVSFAALAVLWRTPKLRGEWSGWALPRHLTEFLDSPELRGALRGLGVSVTGFVAFADIVGPDVLTNPTAGFVYVIFWVGLVPASLLFGPVWRLLNPLRTIHAVLSGLLFIRRPLLRLSDRIGYWFAALSLFSFVWLELCGPDRDSLSTLRLYFCCYAGVHLLGALVFGTKWFDRCDGFEVFSTVVGRLSFFGRRADGALVIRNPLENLDTLAPRPGLAALLAVMLGSTVFDSFSSTYWWFDNVDYPAVYPAVYDTLGLLASTILVLALFSLAARLTGRGAAWRVSASASFAHSLVPISVGYLMAHYFTLLLFVGQETLIRASDPLSDGANWFGTAHLQVNFSLLTVSAIASVEVISIVIGHVVGVFSAHDRAVRLLPARSAVLGQLPMMVLMVGFTLGGLSLMLTG